MFSDASKDALAHTANNARRVANCLVHAELNIVPSKEQCPSPEQRDACFSSESSPGTPFGEEESYGFVE